MMILKLPTKISINIEELFEIYLIEFENTLYFGVANALSALYQQCIDADGFTYENVLDKDLTEEMKQKCPDLASSIEPCLMLK